MKNHKKSTIKIDGDKLKSLLTKTTGKSLSEIAIENGFSKNIISEACSKGFASAIVQNIAKLYGINKEAYEIQEKEPEQMSIEDITPLTKSELKDLIKESIIEVFNSLTWKIDTKTNTVTFLVGNKEVK